MSTLQEISALTQGAFVFWDPQSTDHLRLQSALEAIGKESYCPPPHSVGLAVKKALADYVRRHRPALREYANLKGGDFLVQRHQSADRDGYEVVHVKRDTERNDYTFVFSARVEEELVQTDSYYAADPRVVQVAYDRYRRTISGSAIGKMLVALVQDLHGTCVRTIGGVYYLPEDTVREWDQVVQAVESAGDTQVTRARIVLDDSVIRTVAAAITSELTTEAEVVKIEITSGELQGKALENRAARARALLAKAQKYEQILGVSLASVKEALEMVELASAASALALAAS